jgi:hypothetical protein
MSGFAAAVRLLRDMPNKSRADTVDYVAGLLKNDAAMAYSEVVKTAKAAGYHVYPLIVGLAKNKLGLGRPRKAKRGRPAGKRGPGRPPGRPTGRPRGRPPGGGGGFTGEIVRSVTRMQNDVAAMRSALREIAKTAGRF